MRPCSAGVGSVPGACDTKTTFRSRTYCVYVQGEKSEVVNRATAVDSAAVNTTASSSWFSGVLFRSLRSRNYRLYFVGQLASMCGTWMQTVALSWLVLELTGEGTQVGGVIALQYVAQLLVSPLAGVRIDRVDRRRAVVGAETFLAVQAALLAVVVLTDSQQLWMLYVLGAAQGVGTALEQPARQALLTELVVPDDLPNAVALNGALFQLARIAGPALAGVLIVTIGIGLCFALNALSFVAIIVAVLAMRSSEMFHRPPLPPAPGQVRQGMSYAFGDPLLRMLLASSFVTGMYFGGLSAVVYPLLAKFTFGGNAGTFGVMGALMGAGAAVSALWVARLTSITTRLLAVMTLGGGLALLLSAVAPTLALEYAVLPLVGAFTLAQAVCALTKLQLTTRADLRGRVIALYFMVSAAGSALGGLVLGVLAQGWDPRGAIAVDVALSFALTGGWLLHRRLSA
jgi:MFS family permease